MSLKWTREIEFLKIEVEEITVLKREWNEQSKRKEIKE